MPMYSLIDYSDNYLNTSVGLWQYFRGEPFLNNAGAIVNFFGTNHNSKSFKYKQKITGATGTNGTKNIKIMVPLKNL